MVRGLRKSVEHPGAEAVILESATLLFPQSRRQSWESYKLCLRGGNREGTRMGTAK